MSGLYDIWAPMFRAPFSGDVTQEIAPSVFSHDVQGNREIEAKIENDVASFGKQLGKINEALLILAERADVTLPDIQDIVDGVEAIKRDSHTATLRRAEEALAKLKELDRDAWKKLRAAD